MVVGLANGGRLSVRPVVNQPVERTELTTTQATSGTPSRSLTAARRSRIAAAPCCGEQDAAVGELETGRRPPSRCTLATRPLVERVRRIEVRDQRSRVEDDRSSQSLRNSSR
jgi:hypothetical protein